MLYDINIEILKEIILEIEQTEVNRFLDKLIKNEVSSVDKTFILDKLNLKFNRVNIKVTNLNAKYLIILVIW